MPDATPANPHGRLTLDAGAGELLVEGRVPAMLLADVLRVALGHDCGEVVRVRDAAPAVPLPRIVDTPERLAEIAREVDAIDALDWLRGEVRRLAGVARASGGDFDASAAVGSRARRHLTALGELLDAAAERKS